MQPVFSKKILLVDDDRLMLELTGKALERAGFRCIKALSAAKALAILAVEVPDIILSDYDMPEMNGFGFRQMILADEDLRHIPFVFLTSFTDEDLMMKGLDLRAADFITKNTSMQVIVSKLNNLVETVGSEHERSFIQLKKSAEIFNLRSVLATMPVIEHYTIDFFHRETQQFSGNFVDTIPVDDRETYYLVGKVVAREEWASWLCSLILLSCLRLVVRERSTGRLPTLTGILDKVNTSVFLDPAFKDVSVGVNLVKVDHQTGAAKYAAAGSFPLVLSRAGKKKQRIRVAGPLLGSAPVNRYHEADFQLYAGDALMMINAGANPDTIDAENRLTELIDKIELFSADSDSFERVKEECLDAVVKGQTDSISVIFLKREAS